MSDQNTERELYLIQGLGRHYEDRTHLLALLEGPAGADLKDLALQFMQVTRAAELVARLEGLSEAPSSLNDEQFALMRRLKHDSGEMTLEEITAAEAAEDQWEADQEAEEAQKADLRQELAAELARIPGLRGYAPDGRPSSDELDQAFISWLIASQGFRPAAVREARLAIASELRELDPEEPDEGVLQGSVAYQGRGKRESRIGLRYQEGPEERELPLLVEVLAEVREDNWSRQYREDRRQQRQKERLERRAELQRRECFAQEQGKQVQDEQGQEGENPHPSGQ